MAVRSNPRQRRGLAPCKRTRGVAQGRSALTHAMTREHLMDTGWEDRVRSRAYAIWEREGRPEGGAERHWAQAEEELRAEEQGQAEASAASTAGTETRTGPGGSVGGEPRAADQDRPAAPAEAAGTVKRTKSGRT